MVTFGRALSRRSLKLTYLLFADDSFLFCRSNRNECQKMLDILASYESMSGQQINRGKTSIFFSKSTTSTMRIEIKEVLGFLKFCTTINIWFAITCGKTQKGEFWLHQRKGLEGASGLGRKSTITSRERSVN